MKTIALVALIAAPAIFAQNSNTSTNAQEAKRITDSTQVLQEIMSVKTRSIPVALLQKAECVGIIPNLKRAGFIVGGQYGKGVAVCRTKNTSTGWSAPAMIQVEGGSIGLQIGATSTDVVFLVMNKKGMQRLTQKEFTVGADASAIAGPVGEASAQANAQVNAAMQAEIVSYKRTQGAFAGATLKGAKLSSDSDADHALYGPDVTQEQILNGKVMPPSSAMQLYTELNSYARG